MSKAILFFMEIKREWFVVVGQCGIPIFAFIGVQQFETDLKNHYK